jgi:hypothetical protein
MHFQVLHLLMHPKNVSAEKSGYMGDGLTAVRPAISIQVRKAGTREAGLYRSQSQSKRASGTGIRASSGLIVAYGKLAAFPKSKLF